MGSTPVLMPHIVEQGRETFEELHARLLKGAAERIHADFEQALRLGLIDRQGNPTSDELPEDMLPGAERDFGG